jgi:uncharacterized protein with ParB-like and HNH nuclease domain
MNNDELEIELNSIPEDQQEDESDLGEIAAYKDSVIMNTDWTVETLYNQLSKGNIELQPEFQRRSAWDDTRKSRLIESIVVGMPVPNIVLAENKIHRGRFIVIDGKQRLLSIRDFFDNNLVLKGLDIRKDLNGKTISQFIPEDKEFVENSTIRSSLIRNWSNDTFLYAIFFRLNSGSLPLSPQELRKALVGGKLIEKIEQYLINSDSIKSVFGSVLDKRMRDSELVIRFIAFDSDLNGYNGNLKTFLDKATLQYEKSISAGTDDLQIKFARLDLAISTTFNIFGEESFKKWIGDRFERRVNRAVFDCMARFFCDKSIVDNCNAKEALVRDAFKEICLDDRFKAAIEQTTKSIEATRTRIDLWGSKLAQTIQLHYDADERRIK